MRLNQNLLTALFVTESVFTFSPSKVTAFIAMDPATQQQKQCVNMVGNNNDEPNPPVWPESVKIFRDTDDKDYILQQLKATQDPWNGQTFTCEKHFSSDRHALLFAPGVYRGIDVEIGYYVQLAGLGRSVDDVKFVDCAHGPYVPALNKHLHKAGSSLDTFWRSAENFYLEGDMQWAVSQAAPLRRVHVTGDLLLHDKSAYASGGHLANSKVDGTLRAGGQQQFLIRNVELGKGASGGAWSMVYSGCSGKVPAASPGSDKKAAISVIPKPKVRMEKPYIAMKEDGMQFELRVPRVLRQSDVTVGPLLNGEHEDVRDFGRVRVVRADSSTTQDIQDALDQGKDVVLAPGIFTLERTLKLRHPDQVLLGLGLATLVAPTDGSPAVHVAPRIPGVRIAGIMLEASERKKTTSLKNSSLTLLEWGDDGDDDRDPGREDRPGGIFDLFVRVGGAVSGDRTRISVDYMIRLHSGHIVGDNLWLWRADHGALGPNEKANYPEISPLFWQTEEHEFRVETGAEFNGDDIHLFGLAVEHANGHQTLWNGERGSVQFYQCEFPYGAGHEFAYNEYRGYKVGSNVTTHEVHAPGIYSNFRNENVVVSTAIEHPESPSVVFHYPFTVKLDNNGGIESVVNGMGGKAFRQGIPARVSYGQKAVPDLYTALTEQ
jgi:hypothetical protein